MAISQRFPNMMMPVRAIPLSRGQVAIIDPENWEMVSRFPWYLSRTRKPKFPYYAVTKIGSHTIPLHTLLMRVKEVDHVNGNGLDNRMINLRESRHYQNIANQGKRTGRINSSRFKGVTWDKNRNLWIARITVQGRGIQIGRFTLEIDAARAYDEHALRHFGEFAKTNQMLGLIPEKD